MKKTFVFLFALAGLVANSSLAITIHEYTTHSVELKKTENGQYRAKLYHHDKMLVSFDNCQSGEGGALLECTSGRDSLTVFQDKQFITGFWEGTSAMAMMIADSVENFETIVLTEAGITSIEIPEHAFCENSSEYTITVESLDMTIDSFSECKHQVLDKHDVIEMHKFDCVNSKGNEIHVIAEIFAGDESNMQVTATWIDPENNPRGDIEFASMVSKPEPVLKPKKQDY